MLINEKEYKIRPSKDQITTKVSVWWLLCTFTLNQIERNFWICMIVSIDMVRHREIKRKHGNQCHKVLCLYNTETNIKKYQTIK
jgi:hypothetical protein